MMISGGLPIREARQARRGGEGEDEDKEEEEDKDEEDEEEQQEEVEEEQTWEEVLPRSSTPLASLFWVLSPT